ncbi:hypothetical protein [[Clostridium] polysaccharolyticum]|uniref:Cellulose biosynthesis protein BcsQ n=1 Tax=[Clostridium] polysaccharolyticum TaxID=29364 RepID=A0A1H9YSG2_9FIRM|nr:hypothetical protein [[Clostridium] polysaccharolyticum]SES71462.1 Cellulose biosynthesis protein BcsQ [[Clostridium] polysaccharolyticum]
MKVAFWSNCSGRAGTTSNMACISILCAMLERKKSVLFENHCSLHGLEQILIGGREKNANILRESFSFYDQRGLDGLIRRVHSNYTYKEIMEDVSIKFLDDLIYYLPKSADMNQEYFEYELNQVIKPLLVLLNQTFDLVFVDTAPNHSLSSKLILEEAELVVVNLCQNKAVLDHFFSNYHFLMEKTIFLVGNYQEQSKFNLANLCRRYQIPKEAIEAIPYNVEFGDAVSSGNAVEFLMRNMNCKRQDENYLFMNQATKTAQLVLEHLKKEEVSFVS